MSNAEGAAEDIISGLEDVIKYLDTIISDYESAEKQTLAMILELLGITLSDAEFDELFENLKAVYKSIFTADPSMYLATGTDWIFDLPETSRIMAILGIDKTEALKFFFDSTLWGNSYYGIDQGAFDDLIKNDPNRYFQIMGEIQNRYNMSSLDAQRTMQLLDSIGACSYACLSNTIIYAYKDNPEQFEKDFGFPMYVTDSKGNEVINDLALLVDTFIFLNSTSNGGTIYDDSKGKTVINKGAIDYNEFSFSEQRYTENSSGWHYSDIESYLKSKNENLNFNYNLKDSVKGFDGSTPSYIKDRSNRPTKTDIKSTVQTNIANGKQVSLQVYGRDNDPITIIETSTGNPHDIHGGHAMYVTGADDNGVYLSSWGKQYYISYSELVNNGRYRFDFATITGI